MSEFDPKHRPSQVTVAGWAIAIGSVLLVFAIFDSMGNLNSVDMRDQLTKTLASGSGSGLGISVDDALVMIRVMLFAGGAAAAAAAILGGFVLRGNKGARIGVSIAAVPILLTGLASGDLLAGVVAAAAVLLWTRPARDWFAGRPVNRSQPRHAASGKGPDPRTPEPPAFAPPANLSARQPPPTAGFGTPSAGAQTDPTAASQPDASSEPPQGDPMSSMPGAPPPQQPAYPPAPYQQQYPPVPPPYSGTTPGGPDRMPRPGTVTAACIITFVAAGLTALMTLILMVALAAARSDIVRAIEDSSEWRDFKNRQGTSGVTTDTVVAIFWAFAVVLLVWAVVAVVMAVFAWKGKNWARIVLIISASVTAMACLIGIPVSLAHLAAAVAVIVLLALSTSGTWFHRQDLLVQPWQAPPPPGGYPPAQYPPSQPPVQGPPPAGPAEGGAPPQPPESGEQPPGDRPKVW